MDDLTSACVGSVRINTPAVRTAGPDLLSLALMDARNRTLALLAAFEPLDASSRRKGKGPDPLWWIGHVGWFQEAWVARNLTRHLGREADTPRPRLASIDPQADACFDPQLCPPSVRRGQDLPPAAALRQYLADTLEVTLELLADTPAQDEALHVYRLALWHEDMRAQTLLHLAQALDLDPGLPFDPPVARSPRPEVCLPAARWRLGSDPGGFVPDAEQWGHDQALPALEIDAQPVSWAQFVEFIEDGGYDDPRWWSPQGQAWLDAQAGARRAPGAVEQVRGAVVQRRFGQARRMPMLAAACHVTWHEAQAWCRWAGRCLPTEAQWERAACQGGGQGYAWGDVLEWTADRFHAYPGFRADPWWPGSSAGFSAQRVVRAASWATPARLRHPKARMGYAPEDDGAFIGFRSCAL